MSNAQVGCAEIVGRIVEDLKDESEPYRRMVMETVDKARHAPQIRPPFQTMHDSQSMHLDGWECAAAFPAAEDTPCSLYPRPLHSHHMIRPSR